MKQVTIVFLMLLVAVSAKSQTTYTGKIETGYLKFFVRPIRIDPGPNWGGYNLDENQNGIDVNLINGATFKEKVFVGLGLGYLNFAGISGVSAFADIENAPRRPRWSPLFNLKVGYDHIWNQYDQGTGTMLTELNIGAFMRIGEKRNLYLKSGFLFTQQSVMVPIRIGCRF